MEDRLEETAGVEDDDDGVDDIIDWGLFSAWVQLEQKDNTRIANSLKSPIAQSLIPHPISLNRRAADKWHDSCEDRKRL